MAENEFIIKRMSEIPKEERGHVLDEVVRVEKETWPEEIQAPRDKFELRAEIFPEGFLMVSLPDLGMVGVSTAEIIDYAPENPPTSWEVTTDQGMIEGTHRPDGNALYLVSVGASPRSKGIGVGTTLALEQIEFARQRGLAYLVLGSRIPGFANYLESNPDTPIEQYVAKTQEDGSLLDQELRFYTRCGLSIAKIVPNFMEDDPESKNYGAVMVWENPEKS